MESILIVDDEKNYPLVLGAMLQDEGFECVTANSGSEALDILADADIDLVITDMKMPVMDGLQLLEEIKLIKPNLPVIIMTAHGTVEKAVDAMQKGAYTYILKPFDNDRMLLYVRKALELSGVLRENERLLGDVKSLYSFDQIIGKSAVMRQMFQTILKVAPTNASVLIEGESGTGKELVARSIHFNSARKDKPFIAVNCGALAENLLESELFGHEKGAFTGAFSLKKGRFELADGGTLFLDEIGELPLQLQVKLLRALQEKRFERVGGEKTIEVDIRFIAATNRTLKDEVKAGRFREDLYFRLNVVHFILPPLRERPEDILVLADHFIQKYATNNPDSPPIRGLEKEVDRLLYDYEWPGNVRELENVIERAMIMCSDDVIRVGDLPKDFRKNVSNTLQIENIPPDAKLNDTLELIERKMVERALRLTGGVQSQAAELLGIGKSGLNWKLKKFEMDTGPKKDL